MLRRLLALVPVVLFTSLAFADGAALYRQKTCASCHAADGSGNTPAGKALKVRDLRSDDVQKQSDAELAAVIANGRGKMPPFKSSVNAQQIDELVAFLRTLANKK